MFKIKSSILFLTSLLFISCINEKVDNREYKYSLSYIGGGYDGLILGNLLNTYLNDFNLLDKNSKLKINASINHEGDVYVTNIDNTSDRERIRTSVTLKIYDTKSDCIVYKYNNSITQFYIYGPNEKFISNSSANKEIKFTNTEELVKKFMSSLLHAKLDCEKRIK
tara:strand:- start:2048 stop:2545 length:498 start_codon:yes stop_codon:yes gene_type:complete